MSTIVDVKDVSKQDDVEGLINDLAEATTQNATPKAEEPKQQTATRPEYVEEKYWTGNLEESLQKQHNALRSAQTRLGQLRNEVGDTRKLADELIGIKRNLDLQQNTQDTQDTPLPKLKAADLLDRPDESLDKYLSARESKIAAQYEARINDLESRLTGVTLQSQHSDYADLLEDEDWHNWLAADQERAHLAGYAAQGDTVVANQLIKQYKAERGVSTESTGQDTSGQKPSGSARPTGDNVSGAAAVALETAAAGDTAQGKIYSRTALMLLKQRNPDVYEDQRFQDEILKAYQEDRVR